MLKPDSLRQALILHVPALRSDPAKLSLFVDKGRIAAGDGSLSFEYRYTLNIVAQDYAGDEDALIVPILAWIGEHQPDLLRRDDREPFRFEAELLEAGAADISIWLDLDEPVLVTPKAGGGFVASRPVAPDLDSFGIGCVSMWQATLGGEVVATVVPPDLEP